MKQVLIIKENVKEVLDVLKGSKWVTVEEANFLSELLLHIRNQNSINSISHCSIENVDYAEKTVMFGEGDVFNSLFNKFTFTVADMNCYIGYPFAKDPHHSYYAQQLGHSKFFISGRIKYFIGEKVIGTTTLANELIEKSRRKSFFTYNKLHLEDLLTFVSNGFFDYERDSYISEIKLPEIVYSKIAVNIKVGIYN